MNTVGSLIGLMAAFFLTLFGGKVIADLWNWFAVPIFEVGNITFALGAGLLIMKSLFFPGKYNKRVSNEETIENCIYLLCVYLLAWGFGAIINYCIL